MTTRVTSRSRHTASGMVRRAHWFIALVLVAITGVSMLVVCLRCATASEAEFVYGHDHVLSFEQVARGEPGLIVVGKTDGVITDGEGIRLQRISSLEALGMSSDMLDWGGLSALWGAPMESDNGWELYRPPAITPVRGSTEDHNCVVVQYAGERLYKLLAERNVNVDDLLSSSPYTSLSEFKLGDLPLFGPYWAMREVLGSPSAYIRESDYPEIPSYVQWSFLAGEKPERTVLVVNAVFTKGVLRTVRVLAAYERE